MRDLHVSPAELARRVGEHEQTLAYLTKGTGKRGLRGVPLAAMKKTRASRRRAIAAALNVSEELLGGELSYVGSGWYEYLYSVETSLAAQRLRVKVDAAVARDIKAGAVGADGQGDRIRAEVEDVVNALMRVGVCRAHLLRWLPPRAAAQGFLEPLSQNPTDPFNSRPVIDDAHEAGTLALIRVLEHLLAPWFEGTAALNYTALRSFATPTPSSTPSERESPQAILTGAPVITFRRDAT